MKICPSCLERFPGEAETCPRDGTELKAIQARSDDELVGRVLEDRWIVEELIGRGGMGTVYKGRQRSVDREVAIKVLRTDLSYDEDSVERFFREANLAANIGNPNCVTIFDFGQSEDGQVLYLAMEYLEGESLLERSRRQPLTYGELCNVAGQICSALSAFHAENVVHRDLKPENIFLVDDESAGNDPVPTVKVFDFGIAKSLEEESRSVTKTGDVIGTPPFMSPEQCAGDPLDARSDLYALGCVLFEQLSGRVPFTGDTAVDLLISHAHRAPPRLDQLEPEVPRPLVELVHALLAKSPDDRPQSATEVGDRLTGIVEQLDEETAARKTRGSQTGDNATQRAISGEETTEALQQEDYDTIAELGYVPEGMGRVAEGEPDGQTHRGVWLSAMVIVLAGGVVWAWSAGWRMSATGEGTVADIAPPETSSPVGSDAGRDVAAEGAKRLDSGTSDVGQDAGPSVRETLKALQKARKHANDQTARKDDETSERSRREAERKPTSDTEETKQRGAMAKFPLLTSESAAAIFEKHSSDVRTCFSKHLGQTPDASGSVQLELVVGGDGTVNSSGIAGGSVESAAVKDCVSSLAGDFEFPPTQSGNAVALRHTYSFEFRWE